MSGGKILNKLFCAKKVLFFKKFVFSHELLVQHTRLNFVVVILELRIKILV